MHAMVFFGMFLPFFLLHLFQWPLEILFWVGIGFFDYGTFIPL